MTRQLCLSLCVALAILAGSAHTQGFSDTNSLDLFLSDMTFSDKDGLTNKTSQVYTDLTARVKEYLPSMEDRLDSISVLDGGGCVKINIVWRSGNQTNLTEITDGLKEIGFTIWGQTYTVSFTGCANATRLRFKFYLVSLPWSDTFKDQSSSDYQQLTRIVTATFSSLGGNIRTLEMQQKNGCVEFYVEWDALNSTNIIELTTALTQNGITINNQKYMVQNKPCSGETSMLRFKFYVVSMTWSESFKDHNSTLYQTLMETLQRTFSNMEGKIRTLELAKNYQCVEFYLELDVMDATPIMNYVSTLKTHGISFMDQTFYTVQTKPCEMPTAEVDECPVIPKGTYGACVMACNDSDAQSKCQDGFKCCPNGCGRTCQRVSYKLKINTTVVVSGLDGILIQKDSLFTQVDAALKILVKRNFNVENPLLVEDVELTYIRPYSIQNEPLHLLDINIYLPEDVPNTDFSPCKIRLMREGYKIENGTFKVIDVRLGKNSASPITFCDGIECYGICKELRSDVQYCSCDPGYTGPDCATFDCRTDTNPFANTNESLCQNKGECVKNPQSLDFKCQCLPDYDGALCQVDLGSCPLVTQRRPDLIGLCQSTCQPSKNDCAVDQMCCKAPCGGVVCVDVGFYQKMQASITLDFPFSPELNDTNHVMYEVMAMQIDMWIKSEFIQANIQTLNSLVIKGFRPSNGSQVAERKRETGNLAVDIELRFNESIPVEAMNVLKDKIMADGFHAPDTNWTVLSIKYGTKDDCPYMACAPGSFCVTNFGGEVQCACPKGTAGQLCDVMDCQPGGINLCRNGGTCATSADLQMVCKCPLNFRGRFCEEVNNPCDLGLCINGGTCHNLPEGQHYCECPPGFSGSVCENAANHCPTGMPLMTTSGERGCRTQACPIGFYCNADPIDRWTACCFNKEFLCALNPCQAGGICVADFSSGAVCQCPKGRKGLFCEEASNDTTVLTACQMKQQFIDWLISILVTGTSSLKITLEDVRLILQHMGYQYLPTDMCDQNGNYKSMAQGVLVVNPKAAIIEICLDRNGNPDSDCTMVICDVLSNNGKVEFCFNGGKCVGEITQKLCDCSGTGYHGVRCELKEGGPVETNCTLRRDIAYLALGILNGSVDPMLGLSKEAIQAAVRGVLQLHNFDNIFLPYCDKDGQYEYRGCVYMVDNPSRKSCYCALDDGSKFGDDESLIEPPSNCRKDSCPEEWDEECKQPYWWCSSTVQCEPDTERCAYYFGCNDDMCSLNPQTGCVAKSVALPCDPQPCKDDPFSICQPCGAHGTCYNKGDMTKPASLGYKCECKMGFSGHECEINENICSAIPTGFCESDCIGDFNSGQLCQCDPGYGGVFCDILARTPCQKRKALFDQIFLILNGEFSPPYNFNVTQVQDIVRRIIQIEGGDGIPMLSCTDNGFYDKVECMVTTDKLFDKKCYCVNYNNKPISSNVQPYIGFDVCTAPTDTRDLVLTACMTPEYFDAKELTVCQNGGTCIYDIYAGNFCLCPKGYNGLFCQYQEDLGTGSAEPRSLCEFLAEAWYTSHEIYNGTASWITNDMQKNLYLNLTLNFLQIKGDQSYGLKAECYDNGTFKPGGCYYNLKTGEKGSCKCWNLRALNVEGPVVDSADTTMCSDKNLGCPLMKCYYICEHGYRLDNTGCRTCECLNPCEDMRCEKGQRCVIEKRTDCAMDDKQMTCTQAVCRSADKPGACPWYSPETYSTVEGGLLALANTTYSCDVTCFDDTDCEGDKKCCGICGSICVDPQETTSCMDYQTKMKAELAFINLARDEYFSTWSLSPENIRMFTRITDIKYIWIPTCTDDGSQFKPLQCPNMVDVSGYLRNVSACFCVDMLGTKVEGANASLSNPTNCDSKPHTCSYIEPSQISKETPKCTKDFDCLGNEKCCGKFDHQICIAPVDTSKLLTTLDQILSTLCDRNSQMCQGGSQCVSSWLESGIACQCSSDRVGPFCEKLASSVVKKPSTVCERKKFAADIFAEQLEEGNRSLSFQRILNSVPDNIMKITINSAVWYNCTSDGAFQPKQCVVNAANQMSPIECFCVYEDGTEILGTRTSLNYGLSLFCGENNMTCPLGNALREENGEIHQCEDMADCPAGFTCLRSTYGKQYCCPKKQSTCPATPVMVPVRSQCLDKCNASMECDANYICCFSTCGKRCIPVGGAVVGNICPIGQPRATLLGSMCNSTESCEKGYMCVKDEKGGISAGVCCPDYNVGQCLVPPSTQHCQMFEERYFYNATSKMCKKFKYGGCDPDFNNFKTIEECCQSCSTEGRCKLGQCPSVNSKNMGVCVQECAGDGDCPGQMICCSNGCGSTCVVPNAMTDSDCLTQQMEAKRAQRMTIFNRTENDCDMMTIPVCEANGAWAREQCQTALGICWCVTSKGNYIKNTIRRGVPQCQTITDSMIMEADKLQLDASKEAYSVCDNGKEFHCCQKVICNQKCWAHPDAMCRINPCGGCSVEFYNADGKLVNCSEGLSSCQLLMREATMAVQEHEINAAIALGETVDALYNSASKDSSKQPSKSRSLDTAYPARCQLPPETGPCKGYSQQWYFDPASRQCKMFIWGMCQGNENRFGSPEDCYNACSPSSNPCTNVTCSSTGYVCKLQFLDDCDDHSISCNLTVVCTSKDPVQYLGKGVFVPSCEATGEYSYKQCFGSYCWCVNSTGHYVNGLTVEKATSLICTENGTIQTMSPNDGVCTNGNQPNISCIKACTSKVCYGQPDAVCIVDLCSTNCNTTFVDKMGKEVTCTGDVCEAFKFEVPEKCMGKFSCIEFEESKKCKDNIPCPGTKIKTCPSSVCDVALAQNCSKNPCAICMVDPCTCQPYFIHAKTSANLTEAQCNYLNIGLCELQTCNILSIAEKAMFSNMAMTPVETSLPACDDKGIYSPRQCLGSECYCVDQFGLQTTENSGTSCKAIDKINRFTMTFTFGADFNTLKNNNKLQTLVNMLLNKLDEAGIDPMIIKKVGDPFEGSVKVNITFENTEDPKDMALILTVLEQMAKMGALDLIIDGQTVPLTNMTEEVKTESQVVAEKSKGSGDMLTRTEKIIIGVVCGCVGLLIIGIICYCLCCRKRKQKEQLDDSFEQVREGKKSTQQGHIPVYNRVYEDENKSIKDYTMPFGKPALQHSNNVYDNSDDPKFVKVKL